MTAFPNLTPFRYRAILATESLEIGKAAEHIVCADLLLSGYRAYLSDQGLPYDIVIDHHGRLARVQVKSTCRAKNANAKGRHPNLAYVFQVRRRGRNGVGARLSNEHCDLVALVALDIREVAYFAVGDLAQTVSLYPPGYAFAGKYKRSRYAHVDGFPIEQALGRL